MAEEFHISESYQRAEEKIKFLEQKVINYEKQLGIVSNEISNLEIDAQQLLEDENRFKLMVEQLPSGAVYINKHNHQIFINSCCEAITEYKNEEITNFRNFFDLIFKQNLDYTSDLYNFDKTINFQIPRVLPITTKSNIEKFVEIVVHQNDDFEIWLIKDVNEKHIIENKLIESEKQYRLLFENMINAFAIHEIITDENNNPINYRFVDINKGFELQTGLKREDIIGQKVLDILPETEKHWINIYGNVAINGTEIRFENYSAELDKYFEVYSFSPKKNQFATIFNDITDRKHTELVLQESEEKYRGLVENAFDAIYIWKDNRYDYVNNRFCELIGYSKKEILSFDFNVVDLYSAKTKLMFEERKKRKLNGESVSNEYEVEVYKKNGELIYLDVSTVTIGLKNEQTRLGIVRDITLRKKNEKELLEAKENAEILSRIKSNFISNLSHELRTPLNGILGFSKILSTDVEDEEQSQMCDLIYNNGKRLLSTLNQLLDLSKIESNKLEIQYTTFDVYEVASRQIEFFNNVADSKNIEIIFPKPSNVVNLILDKNLFSSIVSNLVSNAVKFTYKGKITISIHSQKSESSSMLVFEIQDTGIGINKDKFDTIFEEFRQESEGFSRNFEGIGLGLTITKKYVEILGGTISLESEINIGTKFTVKIPCEITDNKFIDIATEDSATNISFIREESENKNINSHSQNNKPNSKKLPKILYLEDDYSSLLVVKQYLGGICEIEYSKSGTDALILAEKNDYELFLLDINLGKGLNGIEVADRLLQSKKNFKKPIIAVTAYAMKHDEEELLSEGFTHYISKPFEKDKFIELINTYL